MTVCQFVFLSVHSFVYLFVRPSLRLSVCLSVCLSIYLSFQFPEIHVVACHAHCPHPGRPQRAVVPVAVGRTTIRHQGVPSIIIALSCARSRCSGPLFVYSSSSDVLRLLAVHSERLLSQPAASWRRSLMRHSTSHHNFGRILMLFRFGVKST